MLMTYLTTFRDAWGKERGQKVVPKRSRDEFEFQPGYLEIIERPPAPWARRTALALISLLVIALIWSVVGRLDIHAVSTGRLIVSSHSKVIQSLEPGEVVAINVRDGQSVKAGEVLISLNPIGVEAEVRELEEQLSYKRLEQARLDALLTDNPAGNFIAPVNATALQVVQARAHLLSEWREVTSNLDTLDGELRVNLANQQARQVEIAAQKNLAANIDDRLKASRTLAASKLLPKVALLEQEREKLELDRSLAQLKAEVSVLQAEYKSKQEQRSSYLAKTRREYYDKLAEAHNAIAVMEQGLIKANEKHRLQSLRSPVDGVVQQLAIHTLGGVVQPAQQLMVIVPSNSTLEAEVMVLNKDVGFVRNGQPVEIKVDSFPYTRYGTITAEVSHVSKDAVQDEKQGLVFPARVKLQRDTIAVDEQRVALQAGMSITAEIRTGERRVIEYLLSPLQQYQSEAMRER